MEYCVCGEPLTNDRTICGDCFASLPHELSLPLLFPYSGTYEQDLDNARQWLAERLTIQAVEE